MTRLFYITLVLLFAANAGRGVAASPNLLVWEQDQLSKTKAAIKDPTSELGEAVKSLKRQADKALRNKSYSVTYSEYVAPSGDKHDYASFGAYWWPDPTKEGGMPFIRRDGETNHEQKKLGDKDAFNEFARDVQTLALGYYFLEDERYAKHAIHLIDDWFLNPETKMNPHLEYAQAVLGRNHGKNSGIIDTRDFIFVLESLELLKQSPSYTEELEAGLKQWFAEFSEWLRTSEHGQKESQANNNHGSWYHAQAMRIALYLGDKQAARALFDNARVKLIPHQIIPDGTQPEELARTNAFHYSIFNLHALATIARMGESFNEDLWHYQTSDGRGMQAAATFLLPFVTGEKEWSYQQITEYQLSPVTKMFFRTLSTRYQQPSWLNPKSEIRQKNGAYDPSVFLVAAYEGSAAP